MANRKTRTSWLDSQKVFQPESARPNKQAMLITLLTGAKIGKRPLLHSAIASKHAGASTPKVIYLSSQTPFMSAFKRVKQLLTQAQKRQMQSDFSQQRSKRGRSALPPVAYERKDEQMIVKATGKAIDKALQLALYLQKEDDLAVTVKTGSVSAIDDIVQDDVEEHTLGNDDVPEARLRHTSMIEIAVTFTM